MTIIEREGDGPHASCVGEWHKGIFLFLPSLSLFTFVVGPIPSARATTWGLPKLELTRVAISVLHFRRSPLKAFTRDANERLYGATLAHTIMWTLNP